MKKFLKLKLKIIYQKLFFNNSNFIYSNKINQFQDKSAFISFLRDNLGRIHNSDNLKSQLEKNLLRSLAFYSKDLIELSKIVFEEVSTVINKKHKYSPVYFSKPYLMIHLPMDKSEEGTLHSDYEYTNHGFFTCWVPLNNYNFPPISTINYFGQIISAFPKTNKLLKYFSLKNIKKSSHPGDINFWSHSYLHKGNRNTSSSTSFVLVTKLSKELLNIGGYEYGIELDGIEDGIIDFNKINYQYLVKKINKLVKDINDNLESLSNLISIFDFLINDNEFNLKLISFYCSVQAQRIWLRPDFFKTLSGLETRDPSRLSILLDISSLISGFQNHSSLERLSKSNISFLTKDHQEYITKSISSSILINHEDVDRILKLFNKD